MNKAVFLDRDGTVIYDRNYLSDPALVELLPGVVEGLKLFKENGFLLIIVSNQSGIARGYFTENELTAVNAKLEDLLKKEGAALDANYYCIHSPDDMCDCRKPAIGMALRAKKEFDIDLSASFMIGDKLSDIQFGNNFGARASFPNIKDAVKDIFGIYKDFG